MRKLIAIAFVAALLAGCTDEAGAKCALGGVGYHDIKIIGYRVFGCDSSKDSEDNYHTGFEAAGPTGQRITGVVCSGVFKGSTIRTD